MWLRIVRTCETNFLLYIAELINLIDLFVGVMTNQEPRPPTLLSISSQQKTCPGIPLLLLTF